MARDLVRRILVTAGCIFGLSTAAVATPFSTLSVVDTSCAQSSPFFESSIGEISTFFDASFGQCAFGGTARSGGGGAGVNLGLVTVPGLGGQPIGFVEVIAETFVEISIGLPKDFAGGLISVSFTPHLSGNADATIVSGAPFARAGRAKITAFASIAGVGGDGSRVIASDEEIALAQAVIFGGSAQDGELLPEFLAPDVILVDPSQTVEVLFRLTARVSHSAFNDTFVTANVLSFNSLSFALLGPALILPDGFTANSDSGLIVNNVFVGAGTNGQQVPEPATLALFGIGLAGLGFLRRRRKAA